MTSMRRPVRRLLIAGAICATLVATAEVGLRLSGITDFALYDTDAEIGYVLRPNQSGAFLNRNTWAINDLSMAAGPFRPHLKASDVLLIGDSIVWGGNPLSQPDRLGPCLEAAAPRCAVWPSCAGSWAALNEITWMQRHPQVLEAVTDLVWVWNTGDFAGRSQWASDLTHPRSRPWSATWYCLDKYLLARFLPAPTPAPAPATSTQAIPVPVDGQVEASILRDIAGFLDDARSRHPALRVTLVLYPNKAQLSEPIGGPYSFTSVYHALTALVEHLHPAPGRVILLDARTIPGWNQTCYRDDIHPTPEGNRLMARWLAGKME